MRRERQVLEMNASDNGEVREASIRVKLRSPRKFRHPGESRYQIHTSLARHVSAKHRPYTSRPEREEPIAKQWEGEGHPCYHFLRRAAQPDCRHFHQPPFSPSERCTKGPGGPHPPNADALGPPSPRCRGARRTGDRRTAAGLPSKQQLLLEVRTAFQQSAQFNTATRYGTLLSKTKVLAQRVDTSIDLEMILSHRSLF